MSRHYIHNIFYLFLVLLSETCFAQDQIQISHHDSLRNVRLGEVVVTAIQSFQYFLYSGDWL